MIGKTILHYKIIEKLGSGSMGDVYKAEDSKLQRTVVLKFLHPELTRDDEARQRFVLEARAASALDHPNIGTIYEINEDDGHFFIAMAYYGGKILKDKIESSESGLDVEDALDIACQIAQGLTRTHSKGIFHRDVKPANILMTKEGQAKIIDFGLAKLKGRSVLTKPGTIMGTVAYMSPEQARGTATDHRSDIWSLGVMLYEMLAGEQPFKGEHEQAIMYLIINEEPEFITKIRKDVPLQLEKIIEKALTKNPEKRYQTMEDMLNDLNDVVAELKEGDSKTASIFKLGKKQRKQVFRSLVVVLILAVIGIYLWQKEHAKTAPISITLLPLQSLTNDVEQEWFTDSMTDALTTNLAKIAGLRVIGPSTAMRYKGTNKTPREIAEELGVQYVIEGSTVKMDDQVKITARLIDALKDEYLWAEEYERGFTNILRLQGEIAQTIASQIQVELTPQEETRLAVSRSVDPETYEMYLKGMYHLNKYTPDGIEKGMAYLHKAVEKDPDEPLAHAGLAIGYDLIAHSSSPTPDALANSRNFATKALELDNTLAEAHYALAMVKLYDDWDRTGAELAFQRALELKPSFALAHAHHAIFKSIYGDTIFAGLSRAQKLDPLIPIYPAYQGWAYFWLKRNDEALKEAEKSLELVPDFSFGLSVLGYVYAAKGMYEQAIETHQKAAAIYPDFKWLLGHTLALAGHKEQALAIVAELESSLKTWETWGLAEIYSALGDNDKAFYWLEQAYQKRHPYIQWLKINCNFDPLSSDPRYKDLARRMNLPE